MLAPLYDRAMPPALTRPTVDAAATSATAIQIRSASRFTNGPEYANAPLASQDELAALLPETARPWLEPRIDSASLLVTRADQTVRSPVGDLQWRDGACAHLTWVTGGCPRDRGDIAVSEADRPAGASPPRAPRSAGCRRSAGRMESMSNSTRPSRHPVEVTYLPLVRCAVCRRTVAHRPGQASVVLTKHYEQTHPEMVGSD